MNKLWSICMIVMALAIPSNAIAQGPQQHMFMPLVTSEKQVVTISSIEEDAQPILCRIIVGTNNWGGQIWCDVVYLSLLQVIKGITTPPPPPPPPPTPTPLPPNTFLARSDGTIVENTSNGCRFVIDIIPRVCNIIVKFPGVTTTICPSASKMNLSFDDDMQSADRIEGEAKIRDEGVLWIEFFPPMYDTSSGFVGKYYHVEVLCSEN